MLQKAGAWLSAAVLLTGIAAALVSAHGTHSAYGPIPGLSGAPSIGGSAAESDCTLCHQDFVNPCAPEPCNLNTPGGGVAIIDLPADYLPGTAIPLRVRLWTDSTLAFPERNWGFQLTAIRESDGAGSGAWVLPAPDTLSIEPGFSPFDTREYVVHRHAGTRPGLAGPVEWAFSWMPPAGNDGRIIFTVAGVAGNGNEEPGVGDFVFTARETLPPSVVPVRPISWGALKGKYRR